MDDLGTDSATSLDLHSTPEPPVGSIHESPQQPSSSPALPEESSTGFAGWEPIGEQRSSYDGRDCLDPSYNLTNEKLRNRGEDEVVIFDYSLSPDYQGRVDGDPPTEGGGPSSEGFSADDDIFSRVPKNELIESKQFDRIIDPTKPRLTQPRGPRLGVIDFPQCYDTHDDGLLNSMGEKLGLLRGGETAFMGAHSRRVRTLPGHGRFRTGVSLRAPFKELSEFPGSGSPESPESSSSKPPKPGSSEDRFILFVSLPYFGESSEEARWGLERESVKLLEFKRLGVGIRGCRGLVVGEEGGDYIGEILVEKGEILVHQARYMIFDSHIMATFRSKEDSAKDQVPLHRFQEHTGAFGAMIQMIASRMGSELWTLGKLQASLCDLEGDIDQMISDAKIYEDNKGMERIPDDNPMGLGLPLEISLTEEEKWKWYRDWERARQNNVWKRKQRRIRDLHTSLNSLSASLFAAISVAERQVAVLQDLHSLFMTRGRAKTKDHQGGYPLWQDPSLDITPTPILPKNPEQIWQGDLATIDEVVQERKSFVQKIKLLVENMEIRREILFGFLKSDKTKTPHSERTAQETVNVIKRTHDIQLRQVQQTQTLSVFTVVTTAFLPLSFCTSYFGMNNIKEFNDSPLSRRDFWGITGPVCAGITLLSVIVILWGRLRALWSIWYFRLKQLQFSRMRIHDLENWEPEVMSQPPRSP